MTILEYFIDNNIPHKVDCDGKIIQLVSLDNHTIYEISSLRGLVQKYNICISNSKITNLDGLIHRSGDLNISYSALKTLRGFEQGNGDLDLNCNKIESLEGFKQGNGDLDLEGNKIESLEGFKQGNGDLDLEGNCIKSIKGFEQSESKYIWLEHNNITNLDGFEQKGPIVLCDNPLDETTLKYWDGYSYPVCYPVEIFPLPEGEYVPIWISNKSLKVYREKIKNLNLNSLLVGSLNESFENCN